VKEAAVEPIPAAGDRRAIWTQARATSNG